MFSAILACLLLSQLAVGSAASCSTTITVDLSDSATVEDCSSIDGSLANRTCNSLQDVLLSLERNTTHPGRSNESADSAASCVELRLLPGHYVLTRNFTIVGLSLKLVGGGDSESVSISFNLSESFDPTQTHSALYVLSLVNSSLVEIIGISFWSSPGIITAHNLENVLVENCSFR